MEEWWTVADRRMYSDQEQFDMLYQKRLQSLEAADLGNKVRILPPEVMNSDPPAMTNLKSHHQVLHLMVTTVDIDDHTKCLGDWMTSFCCNSGRRERIPSGCV